MPTMFVINHVDLADHFTLYVLVVYCYEWLITIDQEFQHIWFRRWSLSTWVFVMNRYATLLDCILDMLPAPNALVLFRWRYPGVLNWHAYVFTGIRAYALCNRNIWVLIIVFTLSMVPFATNMVGLHCSEYGLYYLDDVGTFVANLTIRGTLIYSISVSLSGRAPLIVSDLIVLFATWKRAAGTVRRAARSNVRVPLSEALLRDGKILTHVSSHTDY
ncbi:hypothetical protein BC629DRAFT_1663271 [Irpex lacteus]|nr:hypothetical protein BC629DRAFT_1663271 [Irpex lacteus]